MRHPNFLLPLLSLLLTATSNYLFAQQTAATVQDTSSKLKIESAETSEGFLRKGRELRKLSGNVRLREGNTLIYCDTALVDQDDAILKGKVVIAQEDTVNIFADSAHYYGLTRKSDLFNNVILQKGEQKLYTQKLHYDVATKIASYQNGARLSNGKSQLSSQKGYYYVDLDEIRFKGNVLVTDPDFTVRTDTMLFNTELNTAYFVAPTLISERESRIYCESGFYDIENDFAEFDKNPQYARKDQKGRAVKMIWQGVTEEYILQDSAYIEEPGKLVQANVIRYNANTEVATLVGNAYYKDSTRTITGERLRYDSRNEQYALQGRGQLSDPPNIIEADSLQFNDQLGNGVAEGNVIWQDTASQLIVQSHRIDYNKQTDYLHAFGSSSPSDPTGRPLLKTLVEADTLYLAADTLVAYRPDSSTDARTILAYRDVRIFKQDLQAISDSLSFSTTDSIFWFYKIKDTPLIWSDTSQFSADTIKMALRDKKLDKIWLQENAFVINSEDGRLFNQIKGRYNTAYFKENELREMLVEGSAEAVYYALDDKRAYIGVNQTKCAEMKLYFGNNQVNNIKFYNTPQGKFSPVSKDGNSGKKLEGFSWEPQRRPSSVADILQKKE
jgi:lipopolysaccharide export system protein LptA